MTSSARASIVDGIDRPCALAVLALTTSSKLVACSVGKSCGRAPLRIRSVSSCHLSKDSGNARAIRYQTASFDGFAKPINGRQAIFGGKSNYTRIMAVSNGASCHHKPIDPLLAYRLKSCIKVFREINLHRKDCHSSVWRKTAVLLYDAFGT